jgi:hypothetical protein
MGSGGMELLILELCAGWGWVVLGIMVVWYGLTSAFVLPSIVIVFDLLTITISWTCMRNVVKRGTSRCLELRLTIIFRGCIHSFLSLNFSVSLSGGLEVRLYKAQHHVTCITPALTLTSSAFCPHVFVSQCIPIIALKSLRPKLLYLKWRGSVSSNR